MSTNLLSIQDVPLKRFAWLTAVAEAGSYGEAARRSGVAPSTVQRQLRHLERELGLKLAVRTERGAPTTLTPAGRALARRAKNLLESGEELLSTVDRHRNATGEAVRLGGYPAHVQTVLAAVLRELRDQGVEAVLSGVTDSARTSWGRELVTAVEDGTVDLAIAPPRPKDSTVDARWFYSWELMAMDPAPDGARDPIPLKALAELPLVTSPADHRSHGLIEAAAEKETLRLQIVETNSSSEAVVALARALGAVAVLPADSFLSLGIGGVRPITTDAGDRLADDYYVYWRADASPDVLAAVSLTRELIRSVQSHGLITQRPGREE